MVGPGRAGAGFALALSRAGFTVLVHGRRRRTVPPGLQVTWGGDPPWLPRVDTIVLAVPDDAVEAAASQLARTGQIHASHTVLHLSGILDRAALRALDASGAALGSLHPLQTLSDPNTAPERLRGAVAHVEGDARALEVASSIARAVGLEPIAISPAAKERYHAGAVFASNYLVVLAAVGRDLLVKGGLPEADAWRAIQPLIEGVLQNLRSGTPEDALTGPVARGDVATVRSHLAVLEPAEAALYRALGRAALDLASLPLDRRRQMEEALREPVALGEPLPVAQVTESPP